MYLFCGKLRYKSIILSGWGLTNHALKMRVAMTVFR